VYLHTNCLVCLLSSLTAYMDVYDMCVPTCSPTALVPCVCLSGYRTCTLHTNCLATLANMAPHVHNLNSYASQRLVSLFHMLAKK